MKYKAKYLILASVNVLGAIILFINLIIITLQICFNNSIGEKINNLITKAKDDIKNGVVSAIKASDIIEIDKKKDEPVNLNGNNIVLICLFIITILIAFGYIIKGVMYILSERPNYLTNKGIDKCAIVDIIET